jgi:hypothetical protein
MSCINNFDFKELATKKFQLNVLILMELIFKNLYLQLSNTSAYHQN